MAKILLAASPEPRDILERVLAGHELFPVGTMELAEQVLKTTSIDQIICTIVFDESRMFNLLRRVKSVPEWRRIPFICARVRRNVMDRPLGIEGIKLTCLELGAAAFLDIADYPVDPDRELRAAIERLLDAPSPEAG